MSNACANVSDGSSEVLLFSYRVLLIHELVTDYVEGHVEMGLRLAWNELHGLLDEFSGVEWEASVGLNNESIVVFAQVLRSGFDLPAEFIIASVVLFSKFRLSL